MFSSVNVSFTELYSSCVAFLNTPSLSYVNVLIWLPSTNVAVVGGGVCSLPITSTLLNFKLISNFWFAITEKGIATTVNTNKAVPIFLFFLANTKINPIFQKEINCVTKLIAL